MDTKTPGIICLNSIVYFLFIFIKMNKKYYIVNNEICKSLNFIHLLLSIIRVIMIIGVIKNE